MQKKNHFLIASVILIIIGIGMIGIALGLGVNYHSVRDVFRYGYYTGDYDTESFSKDISGDFKDIELDLDTCDINIYKSDAYKLTVKNGIKDSIHVTTDNNTLKIKQDKIVQKHNSITFFGIHWQAPDNITIDLYIPSDAKFDNFIFSSSVGDIDLESINAKSTQIHSDVGDISITYINSDKTDISTRVGNIHIKSGNINNVNIINDVGDIDISSKLNGINHIKNRVGDIEMNVKGNNNDFYIDADTNIGECDISGDSKSGNGNQSSDNQLIVTNDIGKIEIYFKGE